MWVAVEAVVNSRRLHHALLDSRWMPGPVTRRRALVIIEEEEEEEVKNSNGNVF
jgi:hypothetical protein